jgi:hypothetical protein
MQGIFCKVVTPYYFLVSSGNPALENRICSSFELQYCVHSKNLTELTALMSNASKSKGTLCASEETCTIRQSLPLLKTLFGFVGVSLCLRIGIQFFVVFPSPCAQLKSNLIYDDFLFLATPTLSSSRCVRVNGPR